MQQPSIKTETREVFITEDGKQWASRQEAERHEADRAAKRGRTTYWHVAHGPDLTEGRGYYGSTYAECYGPERWIAEAFMHDWALKEFGGPLAFVQGCSPMENWKLRQIDEARFLAPVAAQVGDYKHAAKVRRLVFSKGASALVDAEGDTKVS